MSRAITKIISRFGLASVLLVTSLTLCCPRPCDSGPTVQNVTAPVSATLNC
jgi:hypothetical protein